MGPVQQQFEDSLLMGLPSVTFCLDWCVTIWMVPVQFFIDENVKAEDMITCLGEKETERKSVHT